jgi:probable F420-dependent oxidoreductase
LHRDQESFVKIGVTFPQTEIGADPIVLRDYAQAAEGMGYSYILAYDHVLGAQPGNRPEGWRGAYNDTTNFHEPFTLFSYLAAVTNTIEFMTGIIILPQRQTALVAKQAAEVDVLSGGRLRLGVGLGWNMVEYESLNEDFTNRGRRISEQVEVLRLLWTQELVDYTGKWHRLDRVGIRPLPVQRPIPIWFGGTSEPVLKRLARIADGWLPQFNVMDPSSKDTMDRLHGYIRDAGRKIEDVGIDGRVSLGNTNPEDWAAQMEAWRDIGATHVGVNTMNSGQPSPRAHIEAIQKFRDAVKDFF